MKAGLIKRITHQIRRILEDPDRIMDLFVKNRWDTRDNPAEESVTSDEVLIIRRNGTISINPNSKKLQADFEHHINVLSTKPKQDNG